MGTLNNEKALYSSIEVILSTLNEWFDDDYHDNSFDMESCTAEVLELVEKLSGLINELKGIGADVTKYHGQLKELRVVIEGRLCDAEECEEHAKDCSRLLDSMLLG